ncbi:hypothetical protein F511_34028, partial [Dorcoceras hygrometricum]
LLWETMILPIIRGNKLDGYVLGTKLCPPEFLPRTTPGSTVKIPNPEYEEWLSNDQLLLGWLYSTMSSDIASQLMQKATSKELWDGAKELSGAQTRSRIVYYKAELQKTKKGGMKMEEYLTTMKAIADNLAMAGNPIPLPDLIVQILSGLDAEYTPIVTLLTDKISVSWIELQTNLLTYESRLEQLHTYQTDGIQANHASAHFATSSTTNRPFTSTNGRGQNRYYNGRGARGRSRGRGGRSSVSSSSSFCSRRIVSASCHLFYKSTTLFHNLGMCPQIMKCRYNWSYIKF